MVEFLYGNVLTPRHRLDNLATLATISIMKTLAATLLAGIAPHAAQHRETQAWPYRQPHVVSCKAIRHAVERCRYVVPFDGFHVTGYVDVFRRHGKVIVHDAGPTYLEN